MKSHLKKQNGHLLKMSRILRPGETPNTGSPDLAIHLITDCSNCSTLAHFLSSSAVSISYEGTSSSGDTASGAVPISGAWLQIGGRNAYGPATVHFTGEYNGKKLKMIASMRCEGGSSTGYSVVGLGLGDDGFSSNVSLGASIPFSEFNPKSKKMVVALSGTSNHQQNITWSGTASILVE